MEIVNYGALFRSAMVTLLRNKMRSILTVLGITIGIAAVICVLAIGKAGEARGGQKLYNLGGKFLGVEAGGGGGKGGWVGKPGEKKRRAVRPGGIHKQKPLAKKV